MPDLSFNLIVNLIGQGKIDEARQEFNRLRESSADLSKEMGVINVNSSDVEKVLNKTGEASAEAGQKASNSAGKHMALRRIMGELNRISPGLGEAFHLLGDAYAEAGEAAETGAVGVAAFDTALEEVLTTLGPLVIAMLAIEATFQYWDMYKEKVEAAAKANEEATKKIVDSTKKALEAVQELDQAMHPGKKNTATQDEEYLKQQEHAVENEYNRQRELNRANEEQELKGAHSEAEREQIKKNFEFANAQLEDWRQKQKAAIEGQMVGVMEKQLGQYSKSGQGLEDSLKGLYQTIQNSDKKIEELEKQKQDARSSMVGPNGLPIDTTDYGKIAELDKEIEAQKAARERAQAQYDAIQVEIKKEADDAAAIREKLDELSQQQKTDSGSAAFNTETNRRVFGAKGENYTSPELGPPPAPDLGKHFAANEFAEGKGIADVFTAGGKVSDAQKQFLVVLEQTITGQHQTFESAVALIEAQSKNQQIQENTIRHAQANILAMTSRLEQLERQMQQVSNNANLH